MKSIVVIVVRAHLREAKMYGQLDNIIGGHECERISPVQYYQYYPVS